MTPAELAAAIIDADSSMLHIEICALLDLDTSAPFTAPLLQHLLARVHPDTLNIIERICAVWHDGFAAGLIASDSELSEMMPTFFNFSEVH